ncbi:MAG: ABC transporter permease [Treponema sp.]|nr:ABC transporter permease [Treponema sp.]
MQNLLKKLAERIKQKNKSEQLKSSSFLIAISAVLLGLLAGGILILVIGQNPFAVYAYMLKGSLMNMERIGNMLATATTLLFTGLAFAFAYKTGLFNIGCSGQMLIGGLFATIVAHHVFLPRPIYLVVLILSSVLGGSLWAAVPGFLKAKFNVHEVVSSIMMNWTAYWSVYYYIPAFLKGPSLETESSAIAVTQSLRSPWISKIFSGSTYINGAIFLGIIAIVAVQFCLTKTTLGYSLKAVGANKDCAEYAGINVKRNVVLSMMISGALAGLAGLSYYTGYSLNMQIGVMPVQGFDGIAVSLLGASSPIGVLLASLFFGILQSGKGFMNAMISVPPEIADTIISIIIYFTATSVLFEKLWHKVFQKLNERKQLNQMKLTEEK